MFTSMLWCVFLPPTERRHFDGLFHGLFVNSVFFFFQHGLLPGRLHAPEPGLSRHRGEIPQWYLGANVQRCHGTGRAPLLLVHPVLGCMFDMVLWAVGNLLRDARITMLHVVLHRWVAWELWHGQVITTMIFCGMRLLIHTLTSTAV